MYQNIKKILNWIIRTIVLFLYYLTKSDVQASKSFRQNFSTTHALINLTENIRQALDEGKIGCGTFVDLQKAFDTVEHEVLLSKLDHYGVRGLTNNWFKSYLTGRKQYVSINSYNYSLSSIAYGVP